MENEKKVLELANLFRLTGRTKKAFPDSLREKLVTGLDEFETVLRKNCSMGRLFKLGRGKFGSVSLPVLKDKSIFLPSQEITVAIINKLSSGSGGTPLKNRLYRLVKQKTFKRMPRKDPSIHKKTLGDCIILDHGKQSAYILKDSLCWQKRVENLGRLLYYKGRETKEYNMRDKIDTFSEELNGLSHVVCMTRASVNNVKGAQVRR